MTNLTPEQLARLAAEKIARELGDVELSWARLNFEVMIDPQPEGERALQKIAAIILSTCFPAQPLDHCKKCEMPERALVHHGYKRPGVEPHVFEPAVQQAVCAGCGHKCEFPQEEVAPLLHCSCGAAVTAEEYQIHLQRGCDAGETTLAGEAEHCGIQTNADTFSTPLFCALPLGHVSECLPGQCLPGYVFPSLEVVQKNPALTEEEAQLVIGAIPLQALPDSESVAARIAGIRERSVKAASERFTLGAHDNYPRQEDIDFLLAEARDQRAKQAHLSKKVKQLTVEVDAAYIRGLSDAAKATCELCRDGYGTPVLQEGSQRLWHRHFPFGYEPCHAQDIVNLIHVCRNGAKGL